MPIWAPSIALVELGVVEDDVGGLAAELERARNQALGGRFGDAVADFGRTREGELVEARVVKHGLARAGAAAGDDVDDAGGEHLVEELAELEERKRRRRGGLDHERVARGEGRRDLPGAHQEREVPRNDLADDADGLVQHDAHRVFVDHDGRALFGAQATRRSSGSGRRRAERRRAWFRGSACRCRAFRPWRDGRRFHR